jgi:hypothetical protein
MHLNSEKVAVFLIYCLSLIMISIAIYSWINKFYENWVYVSWIIIAIFYPTFIHIVRRTFK